MNLERSLEFFSFGPFLSKLGSMSMNFEESLESAYFGPFCFLAPDFSFTAPGFSFPAISDTRYPAIPDTRRPAPGKKNPAPGKKNPAPGKKNPAPGKKNPAPESTMDQNRNIPRNLSKLDTIISNNYSSRNPPRVLPATVSQRFQTGGEVKKKGASAKRHQNTGHSEFKAFFIWTIS